MVMLYSFATDYTDKSFYTSIFRKVVHPASNGVDLIIPCYCVVLPVFRVFLGRF